VDFDFSPEQLAFRDEVEAFLDANEDPVVFDVTRENMAQVADIPERRALMGKVAQQGWLGITWPKEWAAAARRSARASASSARRSCATAATR
jgi:alkylation response protein AidB-like acyl-CoA dehydrogenase